MSAEISLRISQHASIQNMHVLSEICRILHDLFNMNSEVLTRGIQCRGCKHLDTDPPIGSVR